MVARFLPGSERNRPVDFSSLLTWNLGGKSQGIGGPSRRVRSMACFRSFITSKRYAKGPANSIGSGRADTLTGSSEVRERFLSTPERNRPVNIWGSVNQRFREFGPRFRGAKGTPGVLFEAYPISVETEILGRVDEST